MTTEPIGQIFTQLYVDRSTPLNDSAVFRQRLAHHLTQLPHDYREYLGDFLSPETGLWPSSISSSMVTGTFRDASVTRLLNLITLIWRGLAQYDRRKSYATKRAQIWMDFTARALKEENLKYRLDEQCGVHHLIDEHFEQNRESMLRGLSAAKYKSVRKSFEEAYDHLSKPPTDTKAAVRSMFEAVEIQARQMTGAQNLFAKLVTGPLLNLATERFGSDEVAITVTRKMFESFADWVDGVHFYRHGQNTIEPVAPPEGLAVHVLSTGTSFLRLLVEIDAS